MEVYLCIRVMIKAAKECSLTPKSIWFMATRTAEIISLIFLIGATSYLAYEYKLQINYVPHQRMSFLFTKNHSHLNGVYKDTFANRSVI